MTAKTPARIPANSISINNRDLRRLWLAANRLVEPPSGPLNAAGIMQIIRDLGFLQIDTVRNVVRAQDHILWSRNRNYRERMLWPLLQQRLLFEHFTHDASLIPVETYPLWQRQFRRLGARAANAAWYQSGLDQGEIEALRDHIAAEGPLSTHAFESAAESREMWARKPHKKALEQMWYAGTLATSHRENFVKFYDLGERVFPALPTQGANPREQANHLCDAAMTRLRIASAAEIRKFWDAVTPIEVTTWIEGAGLVPVSVEDAEGRWHESFTTPDIEEWSQDVGTSTRIRIINPFDPAIRDRKRLQRLFGFEYRNEMFVPRAERRWGYYVYPLLEGDRFVGRIELKGDRGEGLMWVTGFWPEPGIRWSDARTERLHAELRRFARLAGLAVEPSSLPASGAPLRQAGSP